jgi:cytochrome c oxidase cbb3-type subunit 2
MNGNVWRLLPLAIVLLCAVPAAGEDKGKPRPVTEEEVRLGRTVYLRECAACHGDRGDGDSPAAAFLDIKPRNFTKQVFKLRTTPTGQPPTTEDLLKTVERGIPGTSMPAFSFLTPEERKQVVAYVLSLADFIDSPEPQPIPKPKKAPKTTPESIARGKDLYAAQGCASCHGETGKGDGPAAKTLQDDEGRPIQVRDFTGGIFRGGSEPIDLFYRFTTGMDGTPMPSYGSDLTDEERWALVDYVMSLKVPAPPPAYAADPLQAGRQVANSFGCRACHVLDDGKGGTAGPDLRISGQKLDSGWVANFLKDPRVHGKIYPVRVARMPKLALSAREIDIMAKYLAAIGKRKSPEAKRLDVATVSAVDMTEGKNLFVLRCTECHNLGKVIEIPEAKRQGPDLALVAGRVDYDWSKAWITDPKKIDPNTKMTVPGLTPEQIDQVRKFVWRTSQGE